MKENIKIGITTDSSAGIEYAPFKTNIKVTRNCIIFPNKLMLDSTDIQAKEFYSILEKNDVIPSTTAPTTCEFLKRLNEWEKEGATDVIHFSISTGLSTAGLHAKSIVDQSKEVDTRFHFFDTKTACIAQGYIAKYAEILAEKNYSVEDILAECTKFRDNSVIYFMVGSLKYLIKNGRLSASAGAIGSLMNIKPILRLGPPNGLILPYKKIRTNKKAIDKIYNLALDQGKGHKKVLYAVLHSDRLADAIELKKRMQSHMHNAIRIDVSDITPTVGAHIGPNLLGIVIINLDNLKEEFLLEDTDNYLL
ncbi:MAG: DegV family protein [Bacilli bacterium]